MNSTSGHSTSAHQLPSMQVYKQEAKPVEDIFRKAGLLLDFQITGGIPETMPNLVAALRPYKIAVQRTQQQAEQAA